VGDPELGQPSAEAAARERRAVVGAEGELPGLDRVGSNATLDDGERLLFAAAKVERPGRISRVQQSMIPFR
jgi:hypothetical protein